MADSRTWTTSRKYKQRESVRSMRRCPSRRRTRLIGMSPKRQTVKKWRNGVSGWGRKRPRRSTRREQQRRSASTHKHEIAASDSSWFAASKRSSASPSGLPSSRTWHAVSLSNRNQDDRLSLTSPSLSSPIFSQALSRRPARGQRYGGRNFD